MASTLVAVTLAAGGERMSEIVLHHYPASPYAEKIRAIFGFNKIPRVGYELRKAA